MPPQSRRKARGAGRKGKPEGSARAEDVMLSTGQAGRLLNVTGECIKQWIYNGDLAATRQPNGFYRIRYVDLVTYLKTRQDLNSKTLQFVGADRKALALLTRVIERLGHKATLHDGPGDVEPACYVVDSGRSEGWRFLEKLRHRKNVRVAPVVLLARKPLSDAELDKALRLEVSGILSAPFSAEQIESELRRVLARVRI